MVTDFRTTRVEKRPMHAFYARLTVISTALLLFVLLVPSAGAQTAGDGNTRDVERRVDELILPMMEENKAIGLTVAVVRDGEIKHLKGYGHADRETETPVDPRHHLFRIASITKTFTATAIMQLQEQGLIDPEADVNGYLKDFAIPETFGRPVTVKDLLAHRGGFEGHANFIYAADPSRYRRLGEYLAETVPTRVYPPGERTSYSNWGYSLLGRVIETASGQSWEDYIEDHILKPLGMNATTARQPLGPDDPRSMDRALQTRLASIYVVEGDAHESWRYELLLAAPGGSMSSTAADMARYMMAHLNEGALDDVRILKPESAAAMRERIYPGRPGVDYGYGFRLLNIGQYDVIRHDGGIGSSKSMMMMVPDLNFGVFISSNGAVRTTLMYDAAVSLVRQLAGNVVETPAPALPMSAEEVANFTGAYVSTGRAYTNARKVFGLQNEPMVVSAGPDNAIDVETSWKGGVYVRISERGFQHPDTGDIIAFDLDGAGRAVHVYSPGGSVARERMTWRTDRRVFFTAFALALLLAATRIVTSVAGRSAGTARSSPERLLNAVAVLAAVLVFAAAGTLATALAQAASLGRDLWHQWPSPFISLTLTLTTGLAVVAAAMVVGLIPAFGMARLPAFSKAHYGLFTAALVALVVVLNAWNLIGFNY